MHSEFVEELWRILDEEKVPLRLFVKERYIGGVEEILILHAQAKGLSETSLYLHEVVVRSVCTLSSPDPNM